MRVAKAPQKIRNHEGADRARAAHAELAVAAALSEEIRNVVGAVNHLIGLRHHAAPFRREKDSSAFAVEELHAEPGLKLGERLRNRTLAHGEVLCRRADVLGLGNGKENLTLSERDGCHE